MTSITISFPSPGGGGAEPALPGAQELPRGDQSVFGGGTWVGRRRSAVLPSRESAGTQGLSKDPTPVDRSAPGCPAVSDVVLASEAQLRVHDSAEGTILPYANAWAPIHSYYAVYMASVALLAAQGHEEASNHRAFLSATSQLISQRKLLPLPWSVSAAGCPDIGEMEWSGLPVDADPTASVELLSNPISETFWPRFCKMLETTRKRRLGDRYQAWCKQNDRTITRKTRETADRRKSPSDDVV